MWPFAKRAVIDRSAHYKITARLDGGFTLSLVTWRCFPGVTGTYWYRQHDPFPTVFEDAAAAEKHLAEYLERRRSEVTLDERGVQIGRAA